MHSSILIRALESLGTFSLPGLGSFSSETSPARISFGEKAIFPPDLSVQFEPNSQANGQKLASWLAREWDLPSETSLHFVQNLTEKLLVELQEDGKSDLPGLGSFQKNSGGLLVFQPFAGEPLFSESFGLPRLTAETLQASVRQYVEKEVPVIPLRPFDEQETISERENRKKSGKFRWVAAAAVILALGASSASMWYLSRSENQEIAQTINMVPQAASVVDISSSEEPVAITETPAPIPAPGNAEKKSVKSTVQTPKSTYYVIAGSFKLHEKSSRLQKNLVFRGYDAHQLPNDERGTIRVSVAQFSSKEAAMGFIRQAQELFDEQLWILEQ